MATVSKANIEIMNKETQEARDKAYFNASKAAEEYETYEDFKKGIPKGFAECSRCETPFPKGTECPVCRF